MAGDDVAHARRYGKWRVLAQEPAKIGRVAHRLEAMRLQQMFDGLPVTRAARNPHDPRLPARRCREERVDQRASVASAPASHFQAGEPQLVTAIDRAEKPEARRWIAAVAIVGPEDIAGDRNRIHAPAASILFDEIAVDQRPLELGEKFNGLRRIAAEAGLETALCRRLPDKRAQHSEVANVCGNEHGAV